ncbi:hypothetical protein ACLMJK_009576, partial [Lecanora helva]
MLFGIVHANTSSVGGIFFGKALTARQIYMRVWAIIRYVEFQDAPSKRQKQQKLKQNQPPALSKATASANVLASSHLPASGVTGKTLRYAPMMRLVTFYTDLLADDDIR